jgi:hypothetical protein
MKIEKNKREKKRSFIDKHIIISHDNTIKSFFDVWILIMVGYSCFSSIYYVAFNKPNDEAHILFDWIVEIHFYLDLVLSFFCEYLDPETNVP